LTIKLYKIKVNNNKKLRNILPGSLLIICILHALWAFSLGWHNTLNDHHSFRQSQTAITAYYLKDKQFGLDYETPVLGKPWSIPMEVPFYQLFSARISSWTGLPLDQAGRGVATACYLLTLIPIWFLLREFRVTRPHALLVLCIFLTSPFYLFWSRAFLIESSVLLFCYSYLALVIYGTSRKSRTLLVAGILFGTIAGLAKVTTWLPFLLIVSLWCVRDWLLLPFFLPKWKAIRSKAGILMAVCGIPFLISVIWIRYTNHIISMNPLGIYNDSKHLREWIFGTLDQKLSPAVWEQILARTFTLFGLPVPAWSIILLAMLAVTLTRRRGVETVCCLVLFLLSPLVFTNLHFIHDYYMNANGLFLIAAVVFGILALLEGVTLRSKFCGWILLLFTLYSGVTGYADMYQPIQKMPNSEILQLADYIKKNTSENSVLMILGSDWNPLVPYYSDRRSLMIPDWPNLTEEQVLQALRNLKGEKIGALLVCEPHRYSLDKLLQQAKEEGLNFPIYRCDSLPLR
jgi:hypothetical protein